MPAPAPAARRSRPSSQRWQIRLAAAPTLQPPCLKLPAVFHDRWTCRHAVSFKTRRRAAGQPTRRDHEDDEPPPQASVAELHWPSPCVRDVQQSARRARRSGGSIAGTERLRARLHRSAAPRASTGWRQFRRECWRSSLSPAPVIEAGVDRDRDPTERHGNEHPAKRIQIRKVCGRGTGRRPRKAKGRPEGRPFPFRFCRLDQGAIQQFPSSYLINCRQSLRPLNALERLFTFGS